MIVVTGAGGKLGSAVVDALLRLVSAARVAASVRRPDEARPLAARGVAVRGGDYDDPAALARSFAGADRVLLVSSPGIDHESRAARHRRAIEAAVAAWVGHVYYTSLIPGDESVAYVMKAHLDTEAYLRTAGRPFTILRNGVYAETWEQYLGDVSNRVAAIPADGPVSWASRGDLAEGTARLLAAGGHAGETLGLTDPAALDIAAVAGLFGELRVRPVTCCLITTEDYVARRTAAGDTEEFARRWATTYFGMVRGEFGRVDPFLGRLLGRPLRPIAQVLEGAAVKGTAGRSGEHPTGRVTVP
ncbi:MAG TPA: NAD(P)H-binding protein [Urbifossiella sp.]|jgi:uncharacterized protein YbjT (DUF2867 family)|nr:NAD(P)H-binding protein [Urbifossiella sp.]